jgi:hypothetical protein
MNQRVTPNRGPALLDSVAGRLTTAVGAAFPGERAVFRGHDIHQQLGDMDWMELVRVRHYRAALFAGANSHAARALDNHQLSRCPYLEQPCGCTRRFCPQHRRTRHWCLGGGV